MFHNYSIPSQDILVQIVTGSTDILDTIAIIISEERRRKRSLDSILLPVTSLKQIPATVGGRRDFVVLILLFVEELPDSTHETHLDIGIVDDHHFLGL